MFSATVEVVDQHEMLVDHADAQLDGLARGVDLLGLAPDQDLALVGLLQAVEHLHQGGLAGAVLADQRMHLALAHLEVDLVVGHDAGVAAGHPRHSTASGAGLAPPGSAGSLASSAANGSGAGGSLASSAISWPACPAP